MPNPQFCLLPPMGGKRAGGQRTSHGFGDQQYRKGSLIIHDPRSGVLTQQGWTYSQVLTCRMTPSRSITSLSLISPCIQWGGFSQKNYLEFRFFYSFMTISLVTQNVNTLCIYGKKDEGFKMNRLGTELAMSSLQPWHHLMVTAACILSSIL